MAKREYVEANKRWLEEKAKEEGVQALPRGIYYKVLKSGDPKGASPGKRSIVVAFSDVMVWLFQRKIVPLPAQMKLII